MTQDLSLTHHASMRMQQRGIPPWFVDLLVAHGKQIHDGRGARVVTVDKSTRKRLEKVLTRREYVQAERYFDVYAVVADGDAVVTAAHRIKRSHLH